MSIEFEYIQKMNNCINERLQIEDIKKSLAECLEKVSDPNLSPIDHFDNYQKKLEYESKLKELEEYRSIMNYFNSVSSILAEYNDSSDKKHCYEMYSKQFEAKKVKVNNCKNCGYELNANELEPVNNALICPVCGVENSYIQFNDVRISNDTVIVNKYSYKRVIHFVDKIHKLQACENTKIPQGIFTSIKNECKKEHIKPKDLTVEKIRTYLSKYHYTKYYDNVYQIYKQLTNKTILNNSEQIEVQLVNKFIQVEEVYDNYILVNNKNRTNFINYKYILYKLCQLLGYDEYLKYIQLSKNKSKIQQLDQIWKQIVDRLGYEYIPTV